MDQASINRDLLGVMHSVGRDKQDTTPVLKALILVRNLLPLMSMGWDDWFITHRWPNTSLSGGTTSLPARDWLSACVDRAGCLQASRQSHANTFVAHCMLYYNSSGTLRKILEKGKGERKKERRNKSWWEQSCHTLKTWCIIWRFKRKETSMFQCVFLKTRSWRCSLGLTQSTLIWILHGSQLFPGVYPSVIWRQ